MKNQHKAERYANRSKAYMRSHLSSSTSLQRVHLTGHQPAQRPPGGRKLGDKDADEHDHDDASGGGNLDAGEGDSGEDASGDLHRGHDAAAHQE